MHDLEFKPFHETYKKISFALCISFMYPYPRNEKGRLIAILLLFAFFAPITIIAVYNIYWCWEEKDLINLIRHSAIVGPFLMAFVKIILIYIKRVEVKKIIDEITNDYLFLNDCDKRYKEIGKAAIKNSQIYSETCWSIVITTVSMTYPGMAIFLNTYDFLYKAEPKKYMIHEFLTPYMEPEARFQSPFYEIFFIYMCFCVLLYMMTFIAYDGFFGLTINHACLKIDCLCAALEETMKGDCRDVYWKLICVIKEQCKMFDLVNLIQNTFNFWLGFIFLVTIIEVCNSLYYVTEVSGIDVMYTIVLVVAVIHIYVPCRYATKLKEKSLETADKIYCCGWENVHSQVVRRLIIIMIARSQVPIQIVAFNMINFDMDLFTSILQTSYSLFTLLKS